tara:strand:- start:113 stop:334 length:222 start_codon:yes stop_codon:yes gene_type:complete
MHLLKEIEMRDIKLKRIGDSVHVEFYEDEQLLGIIDYSDKSMHYVDDAVNNFHSGLMSEELIKSYSIKENTNG